MMKRILISIFLALCLAMPVWAADGDRVVEGITAEEVTSQTLTAIKNISGATYGSNESVTDAEFLYINTLGSNVQDQLDLKAPLASPIFTGTLKTGDAINYLDITDGVVTMVGTAKRKLTIRPTLDFANLVRSGAYTSIVPTVFDLGVSKAYSLPVWTADSDEELFFNFRVSYRWDGVTNPTFKILVAIGGIEDIGDRFQFQFSWMNTSITCVLTDATIDDVSEVIVIADHVAQYSTYSVSFEIDIDAPSGLTPARENVAARHNLAGRVRRIAASESGVTAEIIIID